jgi:hypothetical protein
MKFKYLMATLRQQTSLHLNNYNFCLKTLNGIILVIYKIKNQTYNTSKNNNG